MARGRKPGDGSKYDQKLTTELCRLMADEHMSASAAARKLTIKWSTIFGWLRAHPEFADNYDRAREALLEHWAEETISIAEDSSRDIQRIMRTDKNGNQIVEERSDNTAVNRDKLRVETRKWHLSRLMPHKYGETQKVEQKIDQSITYTQMVDRPPAETPEQWQERVQRELSERARKLQESVH